MKRRRLLGYTTAAATSVIMWPIIQPVSSEATSRFMMNTDGLYTEAWMRSGGRHFSHLFSPAASGPSRSVMVFEKRGCPHSEALHREVLQDRDLANAFAANFNVYQLNTQGGQFYHIPAYGMVSERCLSSYHYVEATPTLVFFGDETEAGGIPDEVGRLEGRVTRSMLARSLEAYA